jgi:fatty acid desaturase
VGFGSKKPAKFELESGERIDLDVLAEQQDLKAYDPAKDQEDARRRLAYGLLALLGFVVVALLVADFFHWVSTDDVKDLALAVLSPIVVLVGTALGFYFGGQGE